MAKYSKKNNVKETTQVVNPYVGYDHYIAVDWSQKTMAIARIHSTQKDKMRLSEYDSDVKTLQRILRELKGTSILVLEESSPAHWLYIKLHDSVTKIVVCDPYVNKSLTIGPKNDRIDAEKLCRLLYTGMIREIYHSLEKVHELRKYVSSYIDLVKMGVRLQNQRTGFLSQEGKTKRQKIGLSDTKAGRFIIECLEEAIELYRKQKDEYVALFGSMCTKNKMLKNLCSIPGIAEISAVKIWATMIEPRRFKTANKYLAYCGLVNYKKESGGRVYGVRRPRFSRILKEVYKTAACVVINGQNSLRSYYDGLIEKGHSEHNARHAVARQIAKISYGVAKTGTKYQAKET